MESSLLAHFFTAAIPTSFRFLRIFKLLVCACWACTLECLHSNKVQEVLVMKMKRGNHFPIVMLQTLLFVHKQAPTQTSVLYSLYFFTTLQSNPYLPATNQISFFYPLSSNKFGTLYSSAPPLVHLELIWPILLINTWAQ